ncbi:MAG: polynucleotide adenylyltransferase PcnB [Gammaproteobacteria bacterium]|nr:polynucleotide adenylyltransferase PcnB [Pseudomonadales bacterium]MCP5345504.1 polynucleotide adenylyltransferase PcnB [Pseudomonadales bacterium]
MLSKFFKPRSVKKGSNTPEGSLDSKPAPSGHPLIEDPLLADLDADTVKVVPRDNHCITRKKISPSALKVLYKLDAEGYQAFLVGGSVRDLLMGGTPKDFDIATNATPEQLRELFRNARIIGRRFKIVHIRFGREIIEVTTFRAHHQPEQVSRDRSHKALKNLDSAHSSSGMILRDNVYGDINEDAVRRDFTVNALYYTIRNFLILDFSSGLEDIENHLIRIIGDPVTRYKEDPVRILRAIRFAAKLGFDIEEQTRKPIDELSDLLESIAPARLFDETLKLLSAGYGEKTFALLRQFRVGNFLFPATLDSLADGNSPENLLVSLALRNTDQRLAADKSVTPAFLFAALLWPALHKELGHDLVSTPPGLPELQHAANRVLDRQLQYTAIPKRFTIAIREMWELQLRLQRRNKRSVLSAYQHPRFRAAYDFLLLREESGEELTGLGQWWTDFQSSDADQQLTLANALGGRRRSRRKPRRKRSGNDS